MRKRAEDYSIEKTFVNIIEKMPSGKLRYYNGFIIKVLNHILIFQDHKLPNEFPISFNSIVGDIEPSKQKEVKRLKW